jgi:type IV secretory pathway VirB2 component (pilin)
MTRPVPWTVFQSKGPAFPPGHWYATRRGFLIGPFATKSLAVAAIVVRGLLGYSGSIRTTDRGGK